MPEEERGREMRESKSSRFGERRGDLVENLEEEEAQKA